MKNKEKTKHPKKVYIVSTCCIWHKEIYKQLGVGKTINDAVKITKEYLKSIKLKLNLDQYRLLTQYHQTQRLIAHNNYPSHIKNDFEIIIEEVTLNKYLI